MTNSVTRYTAVFLLTVLLVLLICNMVCLGSNYNDEKDEEDKYEVSYQTIDGCVTPSADLVQSNDYITLPTPQRNYTIIYDANGGNEAPQSQNASLTCRGWSNSNSANTVSYFCGDEYIPDKNVTLYAVWDDIASGEITNDEPKKEDAKFIGWSRGNSASTADYFAGDKIYLKNNITLYAVWKSAYQQGKDTYCFSNYSDEDADGYCFGMALTSSGYYLGLLDKSVADLDDDTDLYSAGETEELKDVIHYYQELQDYTQESIVAGEFSMGTIETVGSDWSECVDYVKNHDYDNRGRLMVNMGFEIGGHAVNFLYFDETYGESRIFIYDNCYPDCQCYLYRDSDGYVYEMMVCDDGEAFDISYDLITEVALLDVGSYFEYIKENDMEYVG